MGNLAPSGHQKWFPPPWSARQNRIPPSWWFSPKQCDARARDQPTPTRNSWTTLLHSFLSIIRALSGVAVLTLMSRLSVSTGKRRWSAFYPSCLYPCTGSHKISWLVVSSGCHKQRHTKPILFRTFKLTLGRPAYRSTFCMCSSHVIFSAILSMYTQSRDFSCCTVRVHVSAPYNSTDKPSSGVQIWPISTKQ